MKHTIVQTCLVWVLLCPTLAFAQDIHIEPPAKGERIQLKQWTLVGESNVDGSPVTDDLTQIVRVLSPASGDLRGTAFLLDNCRVMTNLHVLIGIRRPNRRKPEEEPTLEKGESFVGDTFEFESQPLRWRGGQRAHGRFVVMAHGDGLDTGTRRSIGPDDWAIGYDADCLSETQNLGTFRLGSLYDRYRFENTLAIPLLTAGFPQITVTGLPDDEYPLYVDSNCRLTGDQSNLSCSIWHGSSGSPLLIGPLRLGSTLLTSKGRLIFEAVGIMYAGGPKVTSGAVPNFPMLFSIARLFTGSLEETLKRYLLGPVDVAKLKQRGLAK